jgi:hypothetical protein
MLSSLIDSFIRTPSVLLGAYPVQPLLPSVRSVVSSALQAAVKVRSRAFAWRAHVWLSGLWGGGGRMHLHLLKRQHHQTAPLPARQ